MLNKEKLSIVRKEIYDAICPILDKYQLKTALPKITFDENTFKMNFLVEEMDYNGAEVRCQNFAKSHNIDETIYNATFTYNEKVYTIIDVNSRAKKYPIIAKDSDGKAYKFSDTILLLSSI